LTPKIRLALASVLAVAALGAIAPAANADIYWGDYTTVGLKSATLQIQTNDGDKTATLSGTGAPAPAGSFSPSTLSFGSQPVAGGPTSTANVTLNSTGSADLVLTAGPAASGDISDFYISAASCTGGQAPVASVTLPNGASCVWTIEFNPESPGAKSMTLSIDTNDGTKSANITGTGTAPAGSLSPSAYDFDSHYVATETQATFTLTSSGSADLDLEGINFSGVGAENFGFTDAGTCSPATTSLSNGQSCTVVVNFYPYTSGFKSATLNVSTNDGLKTVEMTGVGIVDPTIVGSGKATKVSLKVKIGCGDDNACVLRLTGKKVGTRAAITPKTVTVGAGQQPVVTLPYSKALRTAIAKGGRIAVTATNTTSITSKSITVRVAR
jgi:hypothetical protein